jgi:hypothetical protein
MQTQEASLQRPESTPRELRIPVERPRWRRWPAVVAVIVGLAAAFGLGAWVGSSATETDTESVEVPAIVNDWGAAFVHEDRDALAALYNDGATFNCRAWDFTIDRDEIVDVVMHGETDFTAFEPTTVLVGDEIITVEYAVTAISPSGQSIATPLLAVFDVAPNGLLSASTIDYDRVAMFPDQI